MSAKYLPEIEKMIATVMKKKEMKRDDAIAHMLAVATGRLNALWRYDKSLPEGKDSKGILAPKGNKKRAERSKPINVIVATQAEKAS